MTTQMGVFNFEGGTLLGTVARNSTVHEIREHVPAKPGYTPVVVADNIVCLDPQQNVNAMQVLVSYCRSDLEDYEEDDQMYGSFRCASGPDTGELFIFNDAVTGTVVSEQLMRDIHAAAGGFGAFQKDIMQAHGTTPAVVDIPTSTHAIRVRGGSLAAGGGGISNIQTALTSHNANTSVEAGNRRTRLNNNMHKLIAVRKEFPGTKVLLRDFIQYLNAHNGDSANYPYLNAVRSMQPGADVPGAPAAGDGWNCCPYEDVSALYNVGKRAGVW